jgi:membrane-associated phospholipid phosphatase
LGGAFIGTALKLMFQRPRPLFDDPVVVEQTWSFPSGHALGSLICYGMLAYLLVLFVRGRHAHAAIIATATALILLIGFSRVQLGVHYLSDVIAGYAAGSVWLCVCIAALETARRRALARVGAVERGVIGKPT